MSECVDWCMVVRGPKYSGCWPLNRAYNSYIIITKAKGIHVVEALSGPSVQVT